MVKIKNKLKSAQQSVGIAYNLGIEKSTAKTLKHYDFYRKISPLFIGIAAVYYFIKANYPVSIMLIGIIHLHISFNQIWWKLVNFEHYFLNKHKDDKDNAG
tara:strand:- start:334 stop:636 length:303 start_codon:yes stop_codon:yes gene_type:complete